MFVSPNYITMKTIVILLWFKLLFPVDLKFCLPTACFFS